MFKNIENRQLVRHEQLILRNDIIAHFNALALLIFKAHKHDGTNRSHEPRLSVAEKPEDVLTLRIDLTTACYTENLKTREPHWVDRMKRFEKRLINAGLQSKQLAATHEYYAGVGKHPITVNGIPLKTDSHTGAVYDAHLTVTLPVKDKSFEILNRALVTELTAKYATLPLKSVSKVYADTAVLRDPKKTKIRNKILQGKLSNAHK